MFQVQIIPLIRRLKMEQSNGAGVHESQLEILLWKKPWTETQKALRRVLSPESNRLPNETITPMKSQPSQTCARRLAPNPNESPSSRGAMIQPPVKTVIPRPKLRQSATKANCIGSHDLNNAPCSGVKSAKGSPQT